MKDLELGRTHIRGKQLTIMGILLMCLCVLANCSGSTYKGEIGDSRYSFQYSKENYLYPHSRLLPSIDAPPPPKLAGSFLEAPALISIELYQTHNGSSYIDSFISLMNREKGIVSFDPGERFTCFLDGIEADYIEYEYQSFDTTQVFYYGVHISVVYDQSVVMIDLLSPSPFSVEEAFNLLKETFDFCS